jgi:hypothetical protein
MTEIPGVFNFFVGGSKLGSLEKHTASEDAVRALLREQTSNRPDIKFGEVICYWPYTYVIYLSENLVKIERWINAESMFEWSTNLRREEFLLLVVSLPLSSAVSCLLI